MYFTQKRKNTNVEGMENRQLNAIIVTKWVTYLKIVDHQRKIEATKMQI
jgi:hypothetical protein